jgi:hypothetical protein
MISVIKYGKWLELKNLGWLIGKKDGGGDEEKPTAL